MNLSFPKRKQNGFTLVELLITMMIFVTLSTVLLIDYGAVHARLAFDNEAQEVALWFREAQAYAMGIRTQGTNIYSTYGVYIDSLRPDQMVIFVDKFDALGNIASPNKRYDTTMFSCGDVNSECLKIIPLRFSKVSSLLVTNPLPESPSASIHVAYTRPNPDARITDTSNAISGQAVVRLISREGNTRNLLVMNSGQVTVQ